MSSSAASRLPIASFKLRFVAQHVRIVPAADAQGCPFEGPGVDLFGAAAEEAFALARPLLAWIEAREPVKMRTLGVDLRKRRFLGTAEDPGNRPRVITIDGRGGVGQAGQEAAAGAEVLFALAGPLVDRLGELAAERLAARAGGSRA